MELTATPVASNREIYPTLATRVVGGWLVYDEFLEQVVELDEGLAELHRWGRRGPGPFEYGNPVSLMRLPSGDVAILDDSPPSVMVMSGEARNEHRLVGIRPEAAMALDDGTILVAGHDGNLQVISTVGEVVRQVASREDLGLPKERGNGAAPEILLRPPFVGFLGPSTVWRARDGDRPRQTLQRCVPDDLARVHERAPLVELPPFGHVPYTVVTMSDFLPLPDGMLTFGSLAVNPEGDRSIEFYDGAGTLRQAWRLTGYPNVWGTFDSQNPRRVLIWNKETIDGMLLIEVDGDRYPADSQG